MNAEVLAFAQVFTIVENNLFNKVPNDKVIATQQVMP